MEINIANLSGANLSGADISGAYIDRDPCIWGWKFENGHLLKAD